jgi:hypothetical protein
LTNDDELLLTIRKLQIAGMLKELNRLGVLRSRAKRETAPIVY